MFYYATIAQLEVRPPSKREVLGSNPSSRFRLLSIWYCVCLVTVLGAFALTIHGKQKVVSSILTEGKKPGYEVHIELHSEDCRVWLMRTT